MQYFRLLTTLLNYIKFKHSSGDSFAVSHVLYYLVLCENDTFYLLCVTFFCYNKSDSKVFF